MIRDLLILNYRSLSVIEREFIIGALTPLLNELLEAGSDYDTINGSLSHLGFNINDLDLISLKENYQKGNYQDINQLKIESIESLQELENFLIFNWPHGDYEKRADLTIYDGLSKNNPLTPALLRRLIALNLRKMLGKQFRLYHNGDQIKFGLESNINYLFGIVAIWLDVADAIILFGPNWNDKIDSILEGISLNMPENFLIQFATVGSPFDAFHIIVSTN
jgi:hypothetical protein